MVFSIRSKSVRLVGFVSTTVLGISYLLLTAHLLNRRNHIDETSKKRMQEIQLLVKRQAEQLKAEMDHHHGHHDHHDDHHGNGKPLAEQKINIKPESPDNPKEKGKLKAQNSNIGHKDDSSVLAENIPLQGEKDKHKNKQENINSKEEKQQLTALQEHPVYRVTTSLKRILLWTPFWDKPDYYVGFGQHPFTDMKCPVNLCELTYDRSLLDASDSVIIHINNVDTSKDLPHDRLPHQSWIFLNLEPPYRTRVDLNQFDGVFNMTMTYRRDSDIPAPFGKTLALTPEEAISNKPEVNYAAGKPRMVAWVVNECWTPSQRSWFGKELERFLPLDIYGRCGYYECNNCLDDIAKKYKFLLSFESCLCKDYVSEHVWEALNRGMVPIVLGAADYSSILPRRSYINVREYRSVEQLANYIKSLHLNDKLYNEYFAWKKDHKVIYPYGLLGFCDLCARLHSAKGQTKVIHNLSQWYSDKSNCVQASEHFKHIESFPYKVPSVKHGDL